MESSRQLKTKIQETKKLLRTEKFLGVDPAGFAPASSGANADMLLHTLRARIHESIVKQKRPLLQEVLSVAPDEWHAVPYQRIPIVTYASESCQ